MTGGTRVRRATKIGAAIAAVVFVASGCNSRLIRPPATVYADGGEYAVKTSVREEGMRFPAVFHAFVPSQVPLHPRDAINFGVRDTGEPHTVALGTLVDKALAKVDALGQTLDLARIEELVEMRRIPTVFPKEGTGKTPQLNASASERCFLDKGKPVVRQKGGAPPCAERDQPDFDGKQPFFSSGILEDGEPFRVKLADDIAPGTYRFMCLVHRSTMTGGIEVRSPGVDRPTVAQLREQADREEESIASALEPSVKAAASATSGPLQAGAGPAGTTRGFASWFFPEVSKAKVGEAVRWQFYGRHSISFEPTRDASEGFLLTDKEQPRVNPDAWLPVGSRALPDELFLFPPRKNNKGYPLAGGTWDGEGSWSSGIIPQARGAKVSYRMRFSEPGTYAYFCLVHRSMRGKIEIT